MSSESKTITAAPPASTQHDSAATAEFATAKTTPRDDLEGYGSCPAEKCESTYATQNRLPARPVASAAPAPGATFLGCDVRALVKRIGGALQPDVNMDSWMGKDCHFCCNIIWVVVAGVWEFLLWGLVGVLLCCTIIGIPFGLQCFKIARLVLWPFGMVVFDKEESTQGWRMCGNVLWLVLFGWQLALAFVFHGVLLCATIVGIPFGLQLIKFAKLAVWPFGSDFATEDEVVTRRLAGW